MAAFKLARLTNRKLIKISGPDCYPYLQGLLCNDLRNLYEPDRVPRRKHAATSSSVLSTFMLNAQGEATEHDELLIECDSKLADGLSATLYGYRVRRKVSLDVMPNRAVWCLYPSSSGHCEYQSYQSDNMKPVVPQVFKPTSEILENDLTLVCDPRLDLMGLRILSETAARHDDIRDILMSRVNITNVADSSVRQYILHRYKLGLGEGSEDHTEGSSLPLECNADLLNSVSFNKGCYLGQELTARIHYTGVVRKRLMPTLLSIDKTAPPPSVPFAPGSDIVDVNTGKRMGVLRNVIAGRGLSLLRHEMLTESSDLVHEATKVPLTVWKPYWWDRGAEH